MLGKSNIIQIGLLTSPFIRYGLPVFSTVARTALMLFVKSDRVTVADPFPIFTGFPWHLNMKKSYLKR